MKQVILAVAAVAAIAFAPVQAAEKPAAPAAAQQNVAADDKAAWDAAKCAKAMQDCKDDACKNKLVADHACTMPNS